MELIQLHTLINKCNRIIVKYIKKGNIVVLSFKIDNKKQ